MYLSSENLSVDITSIICSLKVETSILVVWLLCLLVILQWFLSPLSAQSVAFHFVHCT